MTDDPIAEALQSLDAKRASLQSEVNRLSQAISALKVLDVGLPNRPVVAARTALGDFRLPPARLSVKQMMLNLLYEESDRDWSVNEILTEYESRGNPVTAKDPSNALRAAVAEANKAGTIVRTVPGRYRAAAEAIDMTPPALAYESMDLINSGGPNPEPEGATD